MPPPHQKFDKTWVLKIWNCCLVFGTAWFQSVLYTRLEIEWVDRQKQAEKLKGPRFCLQTLKMICGHSWHLDRCSTYFWWFQWCAKCNPCGPAQVRLLWQMSRDSPEACWQNARLPPAQSVTVQTADWYLSGTVCPERSQSQASASQDSQADCVSEI